MGQGNGDPVRPSVVVPRPRLIALATVIALTGGAGVAAAVTLDPAGRRTTTRQASGRQASGPQAGGRQLAPAGHAPRATGSSPGAAPSPGGLDATLPRTPAGPGAPSPAALPVARLTAVQAPDLLVRLTRPLAAQQLAALRHLPGLRALSVLDTGRVHLGRLTVSAVGVDPSSLRPLTPRETASSDGLWATIARGDLAATYSLARSNHLALGHAAVLSGRGSAATRVGALAVFGLPDAEVVVNRATGAAVGLTPGTMVLLAAPSRSVAGLTAAVRQAVPGAAVTALRPVPVVAAKPKTYRELYVSSARYCPGLSWTVLAAIGQVESGHGRDVGPSSAGALGPMQFLPSTWATSGVDGDGDGRADIMNPFDAVPAAALYLCRDGAGRGGQGLYDAIFSYNHADWYVRLVLGLAAKYR